MLAHRSSPSERQTTRNDSDEAAQRTGCVCQKLLTSDGQIPAYGRDGNTPHLGPRCQDEPFFRADIFTLEIDAAIKRSNVDRCRRGTPPGLRSPS